MDDRKLLVRRDDVGGIAVLTIDNPPVNATSHALRVALKAALEAALADGRSKAVLLLGAGRGFIAGADIAEFDRPRLAPLNPAIIAVMEESAIPVIAAIHGHALGGGLELAMGCHYRIATPEARLGQPEVKIGLIPGAGGTQRLPRLVGFPLALDMIAGGNPIDAKAALEAGLIDAIVTGELRAGVIAFAEQVVREGGALKRVRDRAPPARPESDFFLRARADLARRKPALEAPRRAIDALEAALLPFDQGLARETAIFAETVASSQSKALRHLFFAERDCAKSAAIPPGTPAQTVERVAILGGGTMGGAIAICCADAGLPVTLIEADDAALARAQGALRRHYEASAKRGLAAAEIERRLSSIAGTTALEEARAADLVIEAVTEDLPLKQKVFAALDRIAKPGAILASNTSYLDLDALAAETRRPELVLGLHFFAPAAIMRAMEVVRAAKTSAAALATGMAFGRKIRKLPVVVGACDGFVGNRLLTQRGRELERLLAEGVALEAIDRAMIAFGFPIGPCAAGDLAGLDISYRARKVRGRDWPLADAIVDAGRLGQKSGAGYYRYEPGSRTPLPDPEAQRILDAARGSQTRASLPSEAIVARFLDPMINEGARILEAGIAERAGDIDAIWVYGYGFPAYRGGPMRYADETGLGAICDRLAQSARRFDDDGLAPAPLLARLAREGKGFTEFRRL
ncbi:MAG: 3-hydroxyacyl-CoA dehydrogenase NAD-binding domain-containing protein [Stellaceae bacterium]